MKQSRFVQVVAIALLLLGLLLVFRAVFVSEAVDLIIATGPPGGTYFGFGNQLAWVLGEVSIGARPIATKGAEDNIDLLLDSKVHLALALSPAIRVHPRADEFEKLRVLGGFSSSEALHVLIRNDAQINELMDLSGKNVYVGTPGSSTRTVARQVLEGYDVAPARSIEDGDFSEASTMLIEGGIHAAFLITGTPSEAVERALSSRLVRLLDIPRDLVETELGEFIRHHIQPLTYPNQNYLVRTVSAPTLLLCHRNLGVDQVSSILGALFDHSEELMEEQYFRLEEILGETLLPKNPGGTPLLQIHEGAKRFAEEERERLIIATGTAHGKYWHLGKTLETLLAQHGIPARVIWTDGSVDNALVLNRHPSIAILQHDVAMASYRGNPKFVFGGRLPREVEIGPVQGMRRLASLHREKLHILIRRDKLTNTSQPTLDSLKDRADLSMSLGPEQSGTRVLAELFLNRAGVKPGTKTYLPINEMVDRIFDGELDVGFFMGYVPSEALRTLLGEESVRLLSLKRKDIARLSRRVFSRDTIPVGTYASQLEGEAAIDTLGTRAVLVTKENLPFDVEKITRIVFENAEALDLDRESMDDRMGIPLHPDAETYYREERLGPFVQELSLLQRLQNWWRTIYTYLREILHSLGFSIRTSDVLAGSVAALIFIVLSVFLNFGMKSAIFKGLSFQLDRTGMHDDLLLPYQLLSRVAYLVAGLLIYLIAVVVFWSEDLWITLITDAALIYLTVVGALVVNSLITVLSSLYGKLEIAREISITNIVQMARILVALTVGTLTISIVFDKPPVYVLGSLGALTAVLLLIFKDTILGFVAGLQLSANRMVSPGDWITMPKYGADGDVLEVTLTTVKVQNFDKTIVTIPTYALISESFQNWRGMRESGGRRIKRSVHIDMGTIRFCSNETLERYAKIGLLNGYIPKKVKEIWEWNERNPSNNRRLTNLGTFRAYIVAYLKSLPAINADMTFLVRQLPPTEHGLPVEICVFCRHSDWRTFEEVQSDIFDHILAFVPKFDLKVFQVPSGSDLKDLGKAS